MKGHESIDNGSGAAPPEAETDGPPPFPFFDLILEHILKFLESRRDRSSASLVCKSWCKAEAFTRHELYISNSRTVFPCRAFKRFSRVNSLVLKGNPRFDCFDFMPPNWGAKFAPWALGITGYNRKLEKLCLSRMRVENVDLVLVARSCPQFKELELYRCNGFGTGGLAEVVSHCRQLRILNLFDSDVMDDKVDWISCFPQGGTCLETLIFNCIKCTINFEALEQLVARSPLLKELGLSQFVSFEQLHRLLVRAPQLIYLGTGSFGSHLGEGNGDLVNSLFVGTKSLEKLSGFYNLSPCRLSAIVPICANLSALDLSEADITGKQLHSVVQHCPKLHSLKVNTLVCDEGMVAVGETCKELRILLLSMPDEDSVDRFVTDLGLNAISAGCRQLRCIMYFSKNMTNAALSAVSQNCQELEEFFLYVTTDYVTGEPLDEGFGAIVRNCKKLRKLTVSGMLTDKAFAYIGNYGNLLERLSVIFAGENEIELTPVFKGCPKLRKLEISGCPLGNLTLLSGLRRYSSMKFTWMHACEEPYLCKHRYRLSVAGCHEIAKRNPNLSVEACYYKNKEKGHEVISALYIYPSLEGPRGVTLFKGCF